jgi:hypothetical protein
MNKISLPTVTLIIVDTACYDLATMAIKECTDKAEFGNVLILSDKRINAPGAEWHYIEPVQSAEEATRAYWYVVPPLLTTEHFMVVQWDSWIVNADRWRPEFLKYDYIGAPWWYDDNNVGNGGFSIRSSRLARRLMGGSPPFRHPEDDALCRHYRPMLEPQSFTWAPVDIAGKFSFERVVYEPLHDIFGFHGMFNWPYILDDDQIAERVSKAPAFVTDHIHYRQMRDVQTKLKGMVT